MRIILFTLAFAAAVLAQGPARTGLTADQIIEKSIAATGGREALDKSVSTYTKAIMEMGADEPHRGVIEYWAKAPNKRLIVMNLEEYGEMKNGFDGRNGWTADGIRGTQDVTGPELERLKREATFRPELKWREMYSKAELAGKRTHGGAEVYVVKLTTKDGKPETRFYDARTFLLLRQETSENTPRGPEILSTEMSDYRDVDGVKVPFRLKQVTPMGNITIRMVEVKNNLAIDDSFFAKPARLP